MLLLLTLACSDYELSLPNDAGGERDLPPDLTSSEDSGDLDTGEWGPEDPNLENPPTGGPPEVFLDDCPEGIEVGFTPGEIYVKANDSTIATATLNSTQTGWFHVYDTTIAESGSSQQNETGFVRIANSDVPDGAPVWGSCGDDWIVRDADNSGTPKAEKIYLGTFWLQAGDNALTLEHVCNLVALGECAGSLNQVSGHMCEDSGNPNSVHVLAEGLCVIQAER